MDVLHTQLHMLLILALDRDKWFASWPSHKKRKRFLPRNWSMIPWSSSPQHCLLVKQAVAQKEQKLPTLHREWILSFPAPWATSIPETRSHLMQGDVNIICLSLNLLTSICHWAVINDVYYCLFHSISPTYTAYNFWNLPCKLHVLSIPSFLIL
jgi:hypothetical protein